MLRNIFSGFITYPLTAVVWILTLFDDLKFFIEKNTWEFFANRNHERRRSIAEKKAIDSACRIIRHLSDVKCDDFEEAVRRYLIVTDIAEVIYNDRDTNGKIHGAFTDYVTGLDTEAAKKFKIMMTNGETGSDYEIAYKFLTKDTSHILYDLFKSTDYSAINLFKISHFSRKKIRYLDPIGTNRKQFNKDKERKRKAIFALIGRSTYHSRRNRGK